MNCLRVPLLFLLFFAATQTFAVIRDGGVDPTNLGKGEWIYYMSDATNKLGGNVPSVTNENSLMLYYKSQGIRYIIVKAATSSNLFNGTYSSPQFTANLVNITHTNGILIFGYNRSYGQDITAEIGISDYVFQQGADGFVWDAESEWESGSAWIGTTGPSKAWQLCSTVRSNWPTKFLAHSPFAIVSFHSSFPYKEFGYWCDAVMPQIYHFSTSSLKSSVSAAINWSDVNWHNFHNSLAGMANSNINGVTIVWTNAIKPIAPIEDVYGPATGQSLAGGTASPLPSVDVAEFIDYLQVYPAPAAAGGYNGASFFRTDLHSPVQWSNIMAGTIGNSTNVVKNLVLDDVGSTSVGSWNSVRTFSNGSYSGSGPDTNSFGTNYLTKGQGMGASYIQFTPNIVTSGAYSIYEWHPQRSDASASVPFIIKHSSGTTTVNVNQQANAGAWNLLGTKIFAPGTSGNIRVSDAIPEATGTVMADAIKLVFVPPPVISAIATTNLLSNSITMSWTTDVPADSAVYYGVSTNYGLVASNSTAVTSHAIVLTNLVTGTTYQFAVASRVPQAAQTISSNSSFSTPPTGAFGSLIIDNTAASVMGIWSTSSASSDKYGTDYRFKTSVGGAAYLQFTPSNLAPALYRIYEWHPQGSNRTTNAPHVIHYADGTQTNGVNQQINGGKWNFLGTFYFTPDANGNVQITDAFPDNTHVVMADAIQFIYDGPLPSLNVASVSQQNGALTILFSPFSTGRAYQLQQADTLVPVPNWTTIPNLPATLTSNGQGQIIFTNNSPGARYLRLSVMLQ